MIVFHGSEKIIRQPSFTKGNYTNDYGKGFYCTEDIDLAREWACKKKSNGFVNQYSLDLSGLSVCNLNGGDYHILHWLALLTKHRSYWQQKSIAEQAKNYLQEHFLIDISGFDVITGYRADDSYYSFAQDFIMGTISLQKLAVAMRLGNLGEQIVLKSEKAFEQIQYECCEMALAEEYYVKKSQRDLEARRAYQETRESLDFSNDIYMIDILRGRVSEDELFLQ